LKFLKVASNKAFYDLMKEFMIEREPIHSKYKRYQAKWFKKNTKYAAFGQICPEKKPQYNSSFDDGLT
jgi:hypothetical protein